MRFCNTVVTCLRPSTKHPFASLFFAAWPHSCDANPLVLFVCEVGMGYSPPPVTP